MRGMEPTDDIDWIVKADETAATHVWKREPDGTVYRFPSRGPTCDSCGEPIADGEVTWQRALYDHGELTDQWAWHSDCPDPGRCESEPDAGDQREVIFGLVTGIVFLPGIPLLLATVGDKWPIWACATFGTVLGFIFWLAASIGYGIYQGRSRGSGTSTSG